MDPPPAYVFMPPVIPGAPSPWIGHMDATTAAMRAFDAGLRDGQRLIYGVHKPTLGGKFTEGFYQRGIAFGMVDNGPRIGDWQYADSPASKALRELPPAPWLPAAILPFPSQPPARPPRHAHPLSTLSARPIPHIPLPDGVDPESLAANWEPRQRQSLLDSGKPACWIAPEDVGNFPVSTHRVQEVVESIALVWRPDAPPPVVIQPTEPSARSSGAVYVEGEPSWIRKMLWSKVVSTPWMNVLVFPNRPRISRLAGSFQSKSYGFADYADALWSIREALDDSPEMADIYTAQGVQPTQAFSSLEIEFVLNDGNSCWNVSMNPPGDDKEILASWRSAFCNIEPEDGEEGTMQQVNFRCEVCGCKRHNPGLCPTKAYEEWNGAIYTLQ